MPDGLNYFGLAFGAAILIYLIVRCVIALRAGVFHFGYRTQVHRDDNPQDFAFLARAQIVGTLIYFLIYAYIVYDRFAAEFGWIDR